MTHNNQFFLTACGGLMSGSVLKKKLLTTLLKKVRAFDSEAARCEKISVSGINMKIPQSEGNDDLLLPNEMRQAAIDTVYDDRTRANSHMN